MPTKTAITKWHKFIKVVAFLYRISLPVNKVLLLKGGDSYPICPRCDCTVDREYMQFCDRCGQRLDWKYFEFTDIVRAPRERY